ncbi:autotransporter assembly complex family protein [Methylopila henanensis]|uniref:Autotransporter assembly complex family protein n=1 Tax=Methylopila henanensis TaxID=873516 RepID=A0ABW4K6X1_9HYPH
MPGIPYVTTFSIVGGDAAVEKIASETSSLKTLEKDPPPGPPGLVGRAKLDIERISAALMATGRYGATVDVSIAGVSVASTSAPDVAQRSRRPVPVVVRVNPGPVFTIGRIAILAAERGHERPSRIEPREVGLVTGQPAPSGVVFAAEAKIVDRLRNEGFPFAKVASREVVADHARNQLDVTINVASGPRSPFGEVTVNGTREVDPEVVRGRVPFEPGDRYDPKKMIELRDELAKLDVFSSIRVKEAEAPDAQGRVPVVIDVEEKKFRYVGASAKYGTTEGVSLNAYWGHRNLFGGAEKLRIEAGSSRLITNDPEDYEYHVRTSFEKPGIWTGFDDLLAEVEAMRERPDAYWRDGVRAAAAIRRRLSSSLSIQAGLEVEASTIRDTFGENDFLLVGAPIGVTFDNTNSKLDPTEGVRASLTAAPYFNSGGGSSSINIFKGQISTYWKFDDDGRYVLAGRLGAGAIVGPSAIQDVPANRRFFAGGGGSIRGFAYQNASPKCDSRRPTPSKALDCDDDQPIGGRSLLEASAEMRIKITDTIGVVPFVDAGAAFDKTYPDFGEAIRVGAGIGLRYYTAIGPIRFDVATPVVGKDKNDPTVAFYVSVGQAF